MEMGMGHEGGVSSPESSVTEQPYRPKYFQQGSIWSETLDARMLVLYLEGWSNRIIAEKLSEEFRHRFSRNAIIGRCRRLGFPPRQQDEIKGTTRVDNRPKRLKKIKRIKIEIAARPPRIVREEVYELTESPEMGLVELMQLERHHCRFIVDDGGKTFYCGNVHDDNAKPYCPFHHDIVYRPERPSGWSRPDAARRLRRMHRTTAEILAILGAA